MTASHAELIEVEFRRAWDAYANANHDFEGGYLRGANNRLYYTLFYASGALMLAHGVSTSKHTGMRAFVNKEYVKPGKLLPELGNLYNDLFEQRSKGDYDLLAEFNPAKLAEQFPLVEAFVRAVEQILSELGFQQNTHDKR